MRLRGLTAIAILTFICLLQKGFCQIAGRVVDVTSNTGVAEATVSVTGTDYQTESDGNGNFQLPNMDIPARIAVRHLAYQDTIISISSRTTFLQIELKRRTIELDVVEVSTGYQSIPRERSTGSFAHIDNERFNEQVGADILSRLPAIANGLISDRSTTSSGRLTIRGLSTIRGPKEPLIILDNFPYEGNIDDINPNDIKDITILKDAAAASIWGVRAGNGVIVITTKKGGMEQKLKMDFSAHNRIGQRPDLMSLETMATGDFIAVEESLFERGFYNSAINNRAKPPLTPIVEMLLLKRDNLLDQETYDVEKNRLEQLDVRKDYQEHFYRPSYDQQYFYSMNGGGYKNGWRASLGYDSKMSTNYASTERVTLRFHNYWQLTDRLSIGGEIYYIDSKNRNGRPDYGSVSQDNKRLYPYARFIDGDGNPAAITKKSTSYLQQIQEQGLLLDWTYYPLLDYGLNRDVQIGKNMLINANAQYQFSETLKASVRYQFSTDLRRSDHLRNSESYFVRDMVNSLSQINDGNVDYVIPRGSILDYGNRIANTHNFRTQIDYNKTLDGHEIDVLFGAEVRDQKMSSNANRIYGLNENNLSVANVDFSRQYPHVITGISTIVPNGLSLASTTTRFVSAFANGAYTYDRRYTISGSVRRDATNLFGLATRDKWNLLWSLGGGWNISNEDFFDISNIDYLKLRATYGFSGNIDPAMSAVSTIHYQGVNQHNNMPYARFQNYYNPELRWESVATTNIGLDLGLFGNRLGIVAEYFEKSADNLFGQAVIDPTAGIGPTVLKNVARMETKGFDLRIVSQNIRASLFQWETEWNVSRSLDKIEEYYLDQDLARYFVNERTIAGVEGKPVYSLYSFRWGGLDPENGNPIGFYQGEQSTNYADLYNRSVLEDLEYRGPVLPVWSGSMGNTFSYKDFSLSIRFVYKLGHFFRRNSIHYDNLYRLGVGHPDFAYRWQNPGDEKLTDVPSMIYPTTTVRDNFYAHANVLTEKADHLRVQYINLSYRLDKNNMPRLGDARANIFFNIDNAGILWRANNFGIDPDFYSAITPPPSRIFSLGLRINM